MIFQFNDNSTQMSQIDQSVTKKTIGGLDFLYGHEENNINNASELEVSELFRSATAQI